MKKFMLIITLAMFSANAMANMTVTLYDSYGSTGGGEFIAVPTGFNFTPVSLGANGFETFCMETNEYFRPGRTYNVEISEAAVNGGSGGPHPADPLDPMTAYLYTKFITKSLDVDGYDYGTGAGRVNSANALQCAIWYIEEEITTLPNGLATTFYNDALNAVNSGAWVGTGNVYVMNLYGRYGHNKQDQLVMITPIPAPGAILLGGIGVGLVGWLRRQRIL